ncbi:MAG TPA: hypothetical protein VHQ22_04375 [Terriglobales bacterium]|jgi:hypothetical protein|nr:hypothetical protein [Terriglobales bacterium]
MIKWTFAKNDGGRESGFHDAGVETFKGNFDRYLARELIQNSLDARLDTNRPVQVTFELLTFNRSDVPDIQGLKATLDRCVEYWQKQPKARKFFEKAVNLASAKTITALRIGDSNTTGVRGSDIDRDNNWYNLIRCAGASSKMDDEGGSFGIGKNAPFAASLMRTVLYSTYNKDKEHVFQGVATLVSHTLPNGANAQATGYLGGPRGQSIRDKDEIPSRFLRAKMGTDIIVLGFPESTSWQKDLTYSVLENFWPAIEWEHLVVKVGDEEISRKNLHALMERFSSETDFSAHQYYKAFKESDHTFHEPLPTLGDVSLYLTAGNDELQKKIAMIRKTGMVIFLKHFRSPMPFSGAFICRNDAGNKLLRDMEPPRHDIWDPDHPDKGANRKTEAEFLHFIRESLKNLMPTDESKIISVPGLSRFLPDDDDTPEEEFDGTDELSKSEGVERSPLPEKIEGKKIDPRRTPMQPDNQRPGENDDETEGEGSDPTGQGGSSGGDGNGGSGEGGQGKGGSQGEQSKPAIPIRFRTFATNVSAGVYSVTVQSEKKTLKSANLAVWTVGDDQKAAAEIQSARLPGGKEVPVKGPGLLGPLILPSSKGVLRLEIRLREPLLVAMEVSAHEAE